MAESFPLDWPLGYKRTKTRIQSKFKESLDGSQLFLQAELRRLGARKVVISSNIPLRRDGGIYTEYLSKKIADPGIAVYFTYKDQQVVMCCDQYEYPWENVSALGRGIEAIRTMERYGVSEFMERAFTGFKALPETVQVSSQPWFQVLGVNENSSKDDIKNAYRKLAQVHHPDSGGGNNEMFHRITNAYQQGLASLTQ